MRPARSCFVAQEGGEADSTGQAITSALLNVLKIDLDLVTVVLSRASTASTLSFVPMYVSALGKSLNPLIHALTHQGSVPDSAGASAPPNPTTAPLPRSKHVTSRPTYSDLVADDKVHVWYESRPLLCLPPRTAPEKELTDQVTATIVRLLRTKAGLHADSVLLLQRLYANPSAKREEQPEPAEYLTLQQPIPAGHYALTQLFAIVTITPILLPRCDPSNIKTKHQPERPVVSLSGEASLHTTDDTSLHFSLLLSCSSRQPMSRIDFLIVTPLDSRVNNYSPRQEVRTSTVSRTTGWAATAAVGVAGQLPTASMTGGYSSSKQWVTENKSWHTISNTHEVPGQGLCVSWAVLRHKHKEKEEEDGSPYGIALPFSLELGVDAHGAPRGDEVLWVEVRIASESDFHDNFLIKWPFPLMVRQRGAAADLLPPANVAGGGGITSYTIIPGQAMQLTSVAGQPQQ